MRQLVILGRDIHCAEVADMVCASGAYELLGVIDQDDALLEATCHGLRVLGNEGAIEQYRGAAFALMHVYKKPLPDWMDIVNIIHSSTFVASSARLKRGIIAYPGCFIGANATIGDGVFMLAGSVINHDCSIGERVTLASGATLAGGVRVGARTYIGQSASVRQQITIGEGAFIGMGAVVIRDVPANATVVGNPARVLRSGRD